MTEHVAAAAPKEIEPVGTPIRADDKFNEVIKLAYEEARAALKEQDATLSNIRNRATGLLAAAAVGTSFTATIGLLRTDPAKGVVLPHWAGWTLIALVVLIGSGVMAVLWPSSS
jgi:hypothetical protein